LNIVAAKPHMSIAFDHVTITAGMLTRQRLIDYSTHAAFGHAMLVSRSITASRFQAGLGSFPPR
jgi:hypothetical protein